MKTVIEVTNLKKTYGSEEAVKDISFYVSEGEIFGLLGPNGAGKTTTVECLQGLRSPDSGRLRVLGLDPRHQAQLLRRHIGSQLQESELPDRIKVWEALDLFASLTPNSLDWRLLMEQWGLTSKRNASYACLSGGLKQRLFVALSLVNNPKVVFLDEMTTGLDPAARQMAWSLIRMIREKGATVILVTHSMEEAERICDRVAIIDRGCVAALDSPQSLIMKYADEVKVLFTTELSDLSWLNEIPQVQNILHNGPCVEVLGHGPILALVAAELVAHGITPADLRIVQPSLEDVFFKLIKHGNE